SCRRTPASNAPAEPRPSSSAQAASGAEPLRPTGKNTPFRAVSDAARTRSPTGLGKRVNVMGMGGDCLKVAARLDRGMQRPPGHAGRPPLPSKDCPSLQGPTELVAEPTMISPVVVGIAPITWPVSG